ncbi:hypothetical protein [Nesterenkonia haasae]|uniref:hypothetical protein n=1 Tax=Nesterenkonia haasae TaxID=2587813 RepID=UPI00129191C9|nr:hypothetical protein [Nesterenkonia haasae]NDK31452.1 hypothetical protein [Nesterenkonia haasae]
MAVTALGVLCGCGGSQPDSANTVTQETEPSDTGTAAPEGSEQTTEGTEEAPAEGAAEVEEPGALTDEEKLEVLLSSADLGVSPEVHATHEGLSYFQENIAVEYTHYTEIFDETECATAMDRINVDLVGEDPQSGLAQAYTLPPEEGTDEEYRPQVYAWMLSYDREVDTSSVWNYVHEHCTGVQLQSGTDEVEIEPFTLEDSAELSTDGVSMVIHRDGAPIDSPAAVRHSMTIDFGDNLVMISAVGLSETEFAELAAAQSQKLADYAESQADDA